MRPPPLARQASHPSAGNTGAPPAGGNLAVAVPHEGAVGLFIVPEETGLRMPDELVDGRVVGHLLQLTRVFLPSQPELGTNQIGETQQSKPQRGRL